MSPERRASICVPVCAERADEWQGAIERAREVADIIELRLDCLTELYDWHPREPALARLAELLERLELPIIITLRPREQGGRLWLRARDRAELWRAVLSRLRDVETCADLYADIELDLFESDEAKPLWEF